MKRNKINQSMLAKTIAYILTVISFFLAGAAVFGAYFLYEEDFYTRGEAQLKRDYLSEYARSEGSVILYNFLRSNEMPDPLDTENTNLQFEIYDSNGEQLAGNYDGHSTKLQFEDQYSQYSQYIGRYGGGTSSVAGDEVYTVKVYVNDSFPVKDTYSVLNNFLGILYSLRYAVYAVAFLAALVCIAGFNFLMCCAGHHPDREETAAVGLEKMPFDLLTVILFLAVFMAASIIFDNPIYGMGDVITRCLGVLAGFVIMVRYCMIAAVQIKTGIFWRNMVVFRFLKQAGRIARTVGRALFIFLRGLPLVWNTAAFLAGITALEVIWFCVTEGDTEAVVVLWCIGKAIFIPAALYFAMVLHKLQLGGEALAEGDLDYKVNTKWMFWDFKDHGENLNSMADGLNLAVEERMRSERLKTELITNVSHDIKTPLTSIINYAELIGDEPTDNEKIVEYVQVLQRQSARLKKLIEDLMEASKASTGNMEVHLVPCEVGVLLTQTVGEYEQRLQENGLQLVTRQPEEPVRIMADGKLLWRVFDNLLNNICKYAQSGTRVYLSLEKKDGKALIAFKNTSRYPLDVSAGELMERFVRGDSSRHTEGNGLGISIAQSLTQLQNGELMLTVDGDFFKVELVFDMM